MAQPKGEFDITYFGDPAKPALAGVDYSRPHTALPPHHLAPGTLNCTQHNNFLTSSPWIAAHPFTSFSPAAGEFVMGTFSAQWINAAQGGLAMQTTVVVTNRGVYYINLLNAGAGNWGYNNTVLVHTWIGPDLNNLYPPAPGQQAAFVQVNGVVYISGLWLTGIFQLALSTNTFSQTTAFVAAKYLGELAGRMIALQCVFPGGGGTGTSPLPTVAWSALGIYNAWDPGVNPNAGFNELADVADQITGFATIGRSGFILRQNGITEMDPNPGYSTSGIQPFVFAHLWASQDGVGAYDGSLAQFGQSFMFRSSDNVYAFSLSNGVVPVGDKIIRRMLIDWRAQGTLIGVAGNFGTVVFSPTQWYTAGLVPISGELHYLLAFSAYKVNFSVSTTAIQTVCYVYDYNLSEDAWHVWDMSSYWQQHTQGAPFLGITAPIVKTKTPTFGNYLVGVGSQSLGYLEHFLVPGMTSYGSDYSHQSYSGTLFQFVPFDYDISNTWLTSYVSPIYPLLAMPQSVIKTRSEVSSPGHKATARRVRVQANNAPQPSIAATSSQQADATLTGTGSSATNAVGFTAFAANSGTGPVPSGFQGNSAAAAFQAIQTYYSDVRLTDELCQATITGRVADATNPWLTLPAFRISSISLVGSDPIVSTP